MAMVVFSALFLALPLSPPADASKGVVFVASGIGGLDPFPFHAHWALPLAKVGHEIREVEWQHGVGRLLRDLQDTRHLMTKAEQLARQVRELREADPKRPIYLVGHSAGAGVILAAAEMLPPETVERIILLSPAVSPAFDLRPALRASRGEIVSFSSKTDYFILDLGTSLFGTVDRVYGPSAGNKGFREPADLDAEGHELYRKLVQVPWHWQHLFAFRGGGHASTTQPLFLQRHVAPWLKP